MMIPHVGGLILKENKILLVSKKNKDAWELPGGKVESNEELENALKRELLEELGIIVEVIQAFNEYQFINNDKEYHSTIFECNILKGKVKECSEEIEKVEFIDLEKINEFNLSERTKEVLRDLK